MFRGGLLKHSISLGNVKRDFSERVYFKNTLQCKVLCDNLFSELYSLLMNLENAKAQMRKGTLEFCTLLVISGGPVYASDILKQLKKANLIVVEGTLYPLLTRLKNAKLLTYEWQESKNGPPRKYYSLTPPGQKALRVLKENWQTLSQSLEALLKLYSDGLAVSSKQ